MKSRRRQQGLGALWHRLVRGRTRGPVERLRVGGVRGLEERTVEIWRPAQSRGGDLHPLFLMLDGQTADQWRLGAALAGLARAGLRVPIVAAVPASRDRLEEYGTAGIDDFAGRGRLAKLFQDYLVYAVLPAVREHCGLATTRADTGIFGASMGGLCAFDTAWRHPESFGLAGVFSGSFWWRTDDSSPAAQQASRIVHRRVREAGAAPDLRWWFQAGTRDEAADRDANGVIDAIQDTRELMDELARLGVREGRDMVYREVEGGEHHEATWAEVLPEFLHWAVSGRG